MSPSGRRLGGGQDLRDEPIELCHGDREALACGRCRSLRMSLSIPSGASDLGRDRPEHHALCVSDPAVSTRPAFAATTTFTQCTDPRLEQLISGDPTEFGNLVEIFKLELVPFPIQKSGHPGAMLAE